MRIKQAITAIGAVLCSVSFISAADYEKVLRHQFSIENPAKIVIEADIGDVQLIHSETGEIAVDVLMSISTSNQKKAERAFNTINAEFLDKGEGAVRINVRTNRSGLSWLQFWKKYPDVNVTVLVPENVELSVASGTGDVTGENLNAKMKLATGAGDVRLGNLKGSLSIATGAGDIDLVGFNGKLSASTGAGDFQGSGNFEDFSISTGKGDVDLRIDNPVTENSSISTGMGDIYVALPVGSQFKLAADVGFGDISTEFDIVDTDPDEKSFRGIYNEGSVSLGFSTGFGDFHLARH